MIAPRGHRVVKVPEPGDDGSSLSSNTAVAAGIAMTTQLPTLPGGGYELGGFDAQVDLTFANLKDALADVGAGLADVMHLTVYLTDIGDRPAFNQSYARWFARPYPVRCALQVAALATPGVRVEVTAVAAVPGSTA